MKNRSWMAFVEASKRGDNRERIRYTFLSFFFPLFFSKGKLSRIETRLAREGRRGEEDGRWKRDPGRRSHRTQDVSWMEEEEEGGRVMVDKGIQDERNSLVVRHARDSHMRGACDVYGLLRGGRCRVSARAPNTAWKPFTRPSVPPSPFAHPFTRASKNNRVQAVIKILRGPSKFYLFFFSILILNPSLSFY